ncbi:MAG: cobalt-precorrin-6X reductase [Pseudonocardiales bacterium]|nr:cobalt-precorrin-6X reductase [Pseudonocardiales bacterium]
MRLLILGGTGEARAIARELHGRRDLQFESSLAGRVSNPALPVGAVRIGGFGGVAGLSSYLVDQRIDAVVDATHPFAATITGNAASACGALGRPLLIVRRPGWKSGAGDDWRWLPDIGSAAALVSSMDVGCIWLTTGRRDLAVFANDSRHRYLVRTVDPPAGPVPPQMTLLLDRGPYTLGGEQALMVEHSVDVLVTKDSGGDMTSAKLIAARERGIPVVVVERPALPAGVEVVDSVAAVVGWIDRQL